VTYERAPIRSIAKLQSGFAFKSKDWQGKGVPVIRIKNVKAGRLEMDGCAYVSEALAQATASFRLSLGDILLSMTGEVGERATVRSSDWMMLNQRVGRFTFLPCSENRVDRAFFYHALAHPEVVGDLKNRAYGVAQPNISGEAVGAVEVYLPPLPTQKRIASILSAYDDLIENNTRRIAILEEMARRLYEEWFVHFRFPGHEEAEFRTSEVGDTPDGWPISRLEELIQVNPRTSVPSDGFKPFVPMGSLSETNMVIGPVEQREGNSGTKFQNNDTLVARITPCLENGKTGFVDFLTDEQPVGFGSTEFMVLRPSVLGRCAIYCLARAHAFRDVAIKSMSGSEGRQRVQPDSVKAFLVARPPTALLDRFEDFAWPCFQQVSALAKKNANLRAQRDMLLPKLISGEIDVSGAGELLEAAE
jgi:type I restriction enzyme S subunit